MIVKGLQGIIHAADSLLFGCFFSLPFGTVFICVIALLLTPRVVIEFLARF